MCATRADCPAAPAADPVAARDWAVAAALRRLDAGDVDGAVAAAGVGGGWGRVGDALEAEARRRAAGAGGDVGRAVRFYRTYFDGFPFGSPYWSGLRLRWNEAAADYIDLLRLSDRKDAAGLLRHLDDAGSPAVRPPWVPWKVPHVLRLLDALPAEQVAAAAARTRAAEPGAGGTWACVVPARLKDERTIDLVRARVRPDMPPSQVRVESYPLTVLDTAAANAALWKFASGPDRAVAGTALSLYYRPRPTTVPPGPTAP